MIERIWQLRDQAMAVEDQISKMVVSNGNVARIMTVPGLNVYSASAIMAEIDDISRFSTKEKLAHMQAMFQDRISQETVT